MFLFGRNWKLKGFLWEFFVWFNPVVNSTPESLPWNGWHFISIIKLSLVFAYVLFCFWQISPEIIGYNHFQKNSKHVFKKIEVIFSVFVSGHIMKSAKFPWQHKQVLTFLASHKSYSCTLCFYTSFVLLKFSFLTILCSKKF